ncbi:MAG: hypothetical protein ACOH1I_08330 [Gallionellaceae bacterium]|jgi:hypothetical protein
MINTYYRKLVRTSAIYDLLASAAFATPWSFHLVQQTLGAISPLPEFQPLHVFFVNLLGSIVVVWSLLRIWRPEPIYGLFDSCGRALFFSWQVYYLIVWNITPVVWLFAAFEFFFFVTQAYGYWLLNKEKSEQAPSCRIANYFRARA